MRCVIDGTNLSANDVVELFKSKKNFFSMLPCRKHQ